MGFKRHSSLKENRRFTFILFLQVELSKKLSLTNFSPECLQCQGTVGNTDTDNVIQDLNKLAQHPEHFSFEPHDIFITEDELKARIEKGRSGPRERC